MSELERLLAELCPDGVEFRALGEVASVGTGSSDRKDATADGAYLFYVRSREIYRIDSFEFDEEAVVIPGEGGIGEIFHYVSGKYALHQRAYRIRLHESDLETKFMYHYLRSHFKAFILSRAVSATVTSIRKPMITQFRIPVPPLEVQREIVAILDKMEALEAELEAELEARRRQYAHYRDALLTFDEAGGVPWVPLGEAGTFLRGKRFTKADYADEGIACIHYGEIYTHFGTSAGEARSHLRPDMAPSLRFAEPGDVVVVDVGETPEEVGKALAWIGVEPVAIHDHSYAYRSEVDAVFLSHVMQTSWFRQQKLRYVARTKVNTLLVDGFARIPIPVPEIAVQRIIASQLDLFDALVNDLSSGLPAEIAARRKQYEYYRDRLLSFEELAA